MAKLTIGMPHFQDAERLMMTVQAIRLSNKMRDVEFVFVDNSPNTKHGLIVADFASSVRNRCAGVKYIPLGDEIGPANAKDRVFREASGEIVVCMDCHVLFAPAAMDRLTKWFDENPHFNGLVTGPIVMDGLDSGQSHQDMLWRGENWGTWGQGWHRDGLMLSMVQLLGRRPGQGIAWITMEPTPRRVTELDGMSIADFTSTEMRSVLGFKMLGVAPDDPFYDIPAMGTGLMACRKQDWLGFNPNVRGFGGEECYLHEKYRRAGRRCIALPFLRWWHCFKRAAPVPYPLTIEDKLRNYVLNYQELGRPIDDLYNHFCNVEYGTERVAGPFVGETLDEHLFREHSVSREIVLHASPESLEALHAKMHAKVTPEMWQAVTEDPVNFKTAKATTAVQTPGVAVPTIRAPETIDSLFERAKAHVYDMHGHVDKLRELAGQCSTVVEITRRWESTAAIMAARPTRVISFVHEQTNRVLSDLQRCVQEERKTEWHIEFSRQWQEWNVPECDMLFIKTGHEDSRLGEHLTLWAAKSRRYVVLHDTAAVRFSNGKQGYMGQLREWLRHNPAWTVVYRTEECFGLVVLSCDERDKQALPTVLEQAGNLLGSLGAFAVSGFQYVTEDEWRERLAVCDVCEHRTGKRCAECGCFVESKAKLRSDNCPLGRWPAVTSVSKLVINAPAEQVLQE